LYAHANQVVKPKRAIMPEQVRKEPSERATKTEHTDTADKLPHSDHKSPEVLKEELDDLLDEIDDVLEENAEAFVAAYIQRGGQ